ncbi:D-arabinose 1-dehydrogenase, Zn-dependent alcohol dehydrogenase family [Sanguibacter gelidistatuariae]|uniref:D-arabinose 1-dehydrogenase, Zn-dependent alcohol dehydrogenase family n=1 Tax=Sanguibacter gelidistatuariae TaxID=1814289 RepID=A0A1G6MVG6_9MICO|nr:zinc-binding dehydrogenase [Sanguibacter gelidistatuariae]SDC58955.1 D-arabinose 1-dehydrogenase, Zn-dependent alcohol dehydrogenase family [Sanguibacter gelidistatuariae]
MKVSEVIGPGVSRIVEEEVPVPGPGEVLVRLSASGVCASDRGAWADHAGPEPRRLGHEFAGHVESVGENVYGWAPEAAVTGFASPAFAEHVVVAASDLFELPPNVPTWAGLGEPLACITEAVLRSGIEAGMQVAVVGLGFMGLGALQVVRSLGAEVTAFDVAAYSLELAGALGANAVHDALSFPAALRGTFDVVIEFSGSAAALATAGDLVAQHGTLCIGGYHHDGRRDLDVNLWYRSVTIVSGFTSQRWRTRAALAHGLDLMARRELTFEPLVTHRFPLDAVDEAYQLFIDRPRGFVKAVIDLGDA